FEIHELHARVNGITHEDAERWASEPIPASVVAERLGWNLAEVKRHAQRAVRHGLLKRVASTHPGEPADEGLQLTAQGLARAQQVVRRHRLWEMFLTHEADFAVDHVDRDADDIEHFLPPDVVAELERRLKAEYAEGDVPPSVHPL